MHVMVQGSSELTELFDVEPSEELLERFACALLQTYTCTHNEFTPEQQVSIHKFWYGDWLQISCLTFERKRQIKQFLLYADHQTCKMISLQSFFIPLHQSSAKLLKTLRQAHAVGVCCSCPFLEPCISPHSTPASAPAPETGRRSW